MSRPHDLCGAPLPLIGKPDYEAIRAAHDPVNHPSHYTTGGIQCADAIAAALAGETDPAVAWCRGNAIKYLWRSGKKDDAVQDLQKAIWYIQRAILCLEARHDRP